MKDLNNAIGKIKSFLNITWNDVDTNTEVADMVTSGVSFLDKTAGVELEYFTTPSIISEDIAIQTMYENMCHQAEDLLKNRCFYFREKALDDFKKNYQADINDLFITGSIFKSRVNNA